MIATMALTWFQRLQVAFRGWSRRRAERDEEFLKKNTGWGAQQNAGAQNVGKQNVGPASAGPHKNIGPAEAGPTLAGPRKIDLEGLQVAYLDDSAQIAYYLDTVSGDVIEARDAPTRAEVERSGRFKRVPARSDESDATDRKAFVETIENPRLKQTLSMTIDAQDFRRIIAT